MKTIKTIILTGLFFVGLSQNIYAAEMFAAVESKAYKNYYNNLDYHKLKGEYNLDSPELSYEILKDYRAEVFVSAHIYEIDSVRDVGEEFNFGKDNVAKLIRYVFDKESGFEAGVYQINGGRLIVGFGGTTSQEKYQDSFMSKIKDAVTDLYLLSNVTTNGQIYETIQFIQNIQVDFPNQNITVTGHSLGGGLAQFASLASKNYAAYKKIKAVTFNTAPVPITEITKNWIEDFDIQKQWSDNNNINFMTDRDPLTNILKSVENYKGHDLQNLILNTGYEPLDFFFNYDIIFGRSLKKELLLALEHFLILQANKTNELIYGKRILLETGTGHLMSPLLNATFDNLNDYRLFNNMFRDIPQNTPLYDAVFDLIKNHSVSYPKKEREYKFYPKEYVKGSELAIFLINTFYYDDFRKQQSEITTQTRFFYLQDKFGNKAPLHFDSKITISQANELLKAIFVDLTNQELDKYSTAWYNSNISKTQMRKRLLNRFNLAQKNLLLRGNANSYVTRGELALMLMNFYFIDISELVKEEFQPNYKSFVKWYFMGTPKKGLVSFPKKLAYGVKQ